VRIQYTEIYQLHTKLNLKFVASAASEILKYRVNIKEAKPCDFCWCSSNACRFVQDFINNC